MLNSFCSFLGSQLHSESSICTLMGQCDKTREGDLPRGFLGLEPCAQTVQNAATLKRKLKLHPAPPSTFGTRFEANKFESRDPAPILSLLTFYLI